jgi:cation diffusion facilitator family transporter
MVYAKKVRRVLWITLLLNISVAAAKIVFGFITNVYSMKADGFHSLFDGASNVIGLIGIWLSAKPPDGRHHYGHKKFETMATIGIATILFLTCIEILKGALENIMSPRSPEVTELSFGIMIFTMGVNIFVTSYEGRRGMALKSDFLIADAKHTMSDLITSSTVLISLVATKMGFPVVDSLASLFIAVMIGPWGMK